MGFDASTSLSPLEYKGLTEYGIPDGVIKEPSNAALSAFFTTVQGLENVPEGVTGEEVLAQIHEATSAFCSGTPTAEQLAALPPRLFREFAKWLASEFSDPKG